MGEELIFTILIDGVQKGNVEGIQQAEKHAAKLSAVFKNKITDVVINDILYSSFFNGQEISDEERDFLMNKGLYRNDSITIENEEEIIEVHFLKNKDVEAILNDIIKNNKKRF
jgi:hypothetical protein